MKQAGRSTKAELIFELEALKETDINLKTILDNISDVVFRSVCDHLKVLQ